MNLKPNISGISRYWKEGEDDRREVAKSLGLKPDNRNNRKLVVINPCSNGTACGKQD